MKRILAVLFALLFSVMAWATSLVCRIDETSLYFTGRITTDRVSGTILYEHRCMMGHHFWLTAREMNE